MSAAPPTHLVVAGTERHGVSEHAGDLARALGAEVVGSLDAAAEHPRVHAHLTDRLVGSTPEEAAEAVVALAGRTRLTVTLHDVPQPTDGRAFERRRACYTAWLAAAAGWATCSAVERDRVVDTCAPPGPGVVVPLPVEPPAPDLPGLPAGPLAPGEATVVLFGWVYPGKGHAEALAAAALLGDSPATRPRVVAVGSVSPGHDALADDLARTASLLGVRLEVTGWVPREDALRHLAAATVGLTGHRNLSASASMGVWLAAGRRPLVRDAPYVQEVARLRPGTLEPYADDADAPALAALLQRRLAQPRLGLLAPDAVVTPTLPEAADAYRAWWAGLAGASW